jgi:Homeodomain-like domain
MQPTTISAGRARRGQIILLHADRHPISAIATTVGISRRFVYKWGAAVSGAGPRGIG